MRASVLVFLLLGGCDSSGDAETPRQCWADEHCKPASSPCVRSWCEARTCHTELLEGKRDEGKGDCSSESCEGGVFVRRVDRDDLPLARECSTVRCDDSGPVWTPRSEGSACSSGLCRDGECVDLVPREDGTTGSACGSDAECDVTGDGVTRCTSALYPTGPIDPTSVCIQPDGPCTPGDSTTPRRCDSGHGLCVDYGVCIGSCVLRADGSWEQSCTGKNGCTLHAIGHDEDPETRMFGFCRGGCRVDGDCPTASLCDPTYRMCLEGCVTDTDCAGSKCDTSRGACAFVYAKKLGDACSEGECNCLRGKKATGTCVVACRPGDACPTGFTCDALLPAGVFTVETQPIGMNGNCLRDCALDSDCAATESCALSAGLTQKTCRPK